jgi:endonuclease/exonuclease/phosphatase family metal-dependent hydrolase
MKIKFATWNIACGAEGYYGQAIDDIARCISDEAIDICVLQEVDRFARRSKFIDFPEHLSKATALFPYYGHSLLLPSEKEGSPEREYGNCILSRWPLSTVKRCFLFPVDYSQATDRREKENRSALIANLRLDTQSIWIAATHLAYSPDLVSSSVRKQQIQKLISEMENTIPLNDPIILGGDFNTAASGEDMNLLNEKLTIQTGSVGFTWPLGGGMAEGRPPFITIDHIFTRGASVELIKRMDMATLSDHSLVVANINIPHI